jgi:hypothetical protein
MEAPAIVIVHVIVGIVFLLIMIVQHMGMVIPSLYALKYYPKHSLFGYIVCNISRFVGIVGWIAV